MAHSLRTALIGRTLDDKYRIDRVVGEGGFAVVYAGRHLTLDVPVAVKALLFRGDQSAEHRAMLLSRFSSEAQILARLRHPNIVAVLDFGVLHDTEAGPVPWFVLEWCDGETLDAELRRRRKTSPPPPLRSIDEAWALMRPIVDAVAYGHALGVAHRDLKPSNIMLVPTRNGVSPRVLDFGIAKRVEDRTASGSGETLTNTGAAMFTPGYAAPEQVAMVRTGPWTDVHALGLMFTEILTDQKPYPSSSGAVAAVDPERPTPARFGRDVGSLEPLLAKATALRPGERFADAEQFLEALDSALGTIRLQVPRPSRPSEVKPPALGPLGPVVSDPTFRTGTLEASTSETPAGRSRTGRHRLAIGALALFVAVVLGVGVFALARHRVASRESAISTESAVFEAIESPPPPATATPESSVSSSAASSAPSANPRPAPRTPTPRVTTKPAVRSVTSGAQPTPTGKSTPALY